MILVLIIALAGLVGTSVMIGLMALVHHFKLANADMVRAIGSIYTKSYELAVFPGLLIHYSAGLIFAFGYGVIIAMAPVHSPGVAIILSTILGFAHGMLVGLLLEVEVAEHHPVPQFREAGFGVVASHVMGHIAYGASIGLTLAAAWPIIGDRIGDILQFESFDEILGFAFIWLFLFGVPLMFIGYVIYSVLTEEVRSTAHTLDKEHNKKSVNSDAA